MWKRDGWNFSRVRMAKETVRKCSHCGNNGHNSRTCNEKFGLKLFGVRISKDKHMKKSLSMGNLQSCTVEHNSGDPGYLSDGPVQARRERKKGIPWTEEEHRTFLAGLESLGKGDWRGISRNFVPSRTPTQVASHAQKYFLRQATSNRKKRRSSLFDDPSHTAPDLPLKPIIQFPEQAGTSAQIAKQVAVRGLEGPTVVPVSATCTAPDFVGMPHMGGISCGKLTNPAATTDLPTASFIPAVNHPILDYGYLPKACTTLASTAISLESAFNLCPQPVMQCASQAAPGTSAVNTDLELAIGPPQAHNQTNLSSQTSNLSGAIRVV
ncbi:PREDICTED: transcription factor MYB1R1-like isoform X2 [Nelumbo nucifera]|uniref:Transcription factor MYB1R1-like isoform X2 n=2 Tax=Nelumbo nucifera TaxID=4432 RepID=A0A1U8A1X8_NELNU|nr:PREDICTED: transcription factor MYB1R1-like isoform X2 [Nelumbo nucifera]DAD47678.1 TPA_asm: hypothetical protein HUJ06_017615 [Nelumbo nucifera]